jgi:hypothetical protein
MFSWIKSLRKPQEDLPSLSDFEKQCPDCGVDRGVIHDLFCTKERCPFCGGQLISCDCKNDVLALNEEERRFVDEGVDDSVEPLLGIMDRWKSALNHKGRIPYESHPLSVTPEGLILVSARGYMPFVRKLLSEGVPVDARNEVGHTPAMASARNYQTEVLSLLLHLGADISLGNDYGHTPLHCAVGSPTQDSSPIALRQEECVRLLLEHGAEVDATDKTGGTPLMDAAWFGCTRSVTRLLRAKADPTLRDNRGRTAADLARERGHIHIAETIFAAMRS